MEKLTFFSSPSAGFLSVVSESMSDIIRVWTVNIVSTAAAAATSVTVPAATAVAWTAPSVRMMFNLFTRNKKEKKVNIFNIQEENAMLKIRIKQKRYMQFM